MRFKIVKICIWNIEENILTDSILMRVVVGTFGMVKARTVIRCTGCEYSRRGISSPPVFVQDNDIFTLAQTYRSPVVPATFHVMVCRGHPAMNSCIGCCYPERSWSCYHRYNHVGELRSTNTNRCSRTVNSIISSLTWNYVREQNWVLLAFTPFASPPVSGRLPMPCKYGWKPWEISL